VIERLEDLPNDVIGFRASGTIGSDEYRAMIAPIYAALDEDKKLNIYFELAGDFHGLDLGALWQDLKAAGSIGLMDRSSWRRMALVTDKDWVRHGAAVAGWLAPGELRLFDPEDTGLAKAWVAEPTSA